MKQLTILRAMKRTSFAGMNCSVARTLEIVGEWWTLLIIRDAFLNVHRFEDFQRRLGIARNVLTDRLETLVEHEILERRLYQERPSRHEYYLTGKGRDLYPVIVSLVRWGDRWAPGDSGPPIVLEHIPCSHTMMPALICPHCRGTVTADTVLTLARTGADKRP